MLNPTWPKFHFNLSTYNLFLFSLIQKCDVFAMFQIYMIMCTYVPISNLLVAPRSLDLPFSSSSSLFSPTSTTSPVRLWSI